MRDLTTASFAALKLVPRRPRKPFAKLEDFFAVIFTFASVYCSGHVDSPEKLLTVGQELLADLRCIALAKNSCVAEVSLAFGGLLGQNMTKIHLLVLDLTASGKGKALRGASFAFHLWHDTTTSSFFCFGGERHRHETAFHCRLFLDYVIVSKLA